MTEVGDGGGRTVIDDGGTILWLTTAPGRRFRFTATVGGYGDDDNLRGSPELVIEVLPPSNTKREMYEKATLYLAAGAQEFWVVDAKKKIVTAVNHEGSLVYEAGQQIPLMLFGGELSVSDIFA